MADNYLENQYERYLAKKAAWEKSRKLGKKKPLTTAGSSRPEPMDAPSDLAKEFEHQSDFEPEEDE